MLAMLGLLCCSEPQKLREDGTGADTGESHVATGSGDAGPSRAASDASSRATGAKPVGSDASDGTLKGAENATDAGVVSAGDGTMARDGATDAGAPATDSGTSDAPATACATIKLPAASQLPPQPKHPDPFKMLDGSRITHKAQWPCRRAEIQAQLETYESGPKPSVAPEDVRASWSNKTLSITVGNAGKSIRWSVDIDRPAGASGPAPLLIAFTFSTLDSSVFSENGVATLLFKHDDLGAQNGAASRGTGLFYDLYGKDHPASSMVAWAWGVSRIIDALEKTPQAEIDTHRIAVTGCSRYGKGALLAGALDDRIALTIPQESGAGGSASWRVSQAQSQAGVNVQTLSNAAGEQPWFRADFGQTFGGNNVARLPFDHHMVMGLVAPRPLLVIDNAIDWLGIDSSYTDGSIAHTIWEAHGIGDRMGYSQSSAHTHCEFPMEQRAILDAYVKTFLLGTGTSDTNIVKAASAKADLSAWMDWTAPTLQ